MEIEEWSLDENKERTPTTDDNVDACGHAKLPPKEEHMATEVVDGYVGPKKVTKHAFDVTTRDATTLATDGPERRRKSKTEP